MDFKVLINDEVKRILLHAEDSLRRRLRKAFEYLENGLWEGGLRVKKLKGLSHKTVLEGRISLGDRILFTLGRERPTKASPAGLVYVWAISTHDELDAKGRTIFPEAAPFLSFSDFEETSVEDVGLDELDSSFFSQEALEEISSHDTAPQRWYLLDDREWKRLLLYSGEEHEVFLYLTKEQREILEKAPPLFTSGTAGSGKTTLCVYYLLQPFLSGKSKLFLTYNSHLKDFSQRLYEGLSALAEPPDPLPAEFLTFKELCRKSVPEVEKNFPATREVDVFSFYELFRKFKGSRRYDAPLIWEEIRSIIKGAKPQLNPDRIPKLLPKASTPEPDPGILENLKEFLLEVHESDFREKAERLLLKGTKIGLEDWLKQGERLWAGAYPDFLAALRAIASEMARHERDFSSPLLSYSEYERLGRKRAPNFLFNRKEIYEIAGWYQKALEAEGLWDEIDLTRAAIRAAQSGDAASSRYDFVCCDEVQDLTDIQLSLLIRLPKNSKNLLLAGDPKQIVNPSGFRWEEARKLFYSRNLPVPELHYLTLNFRCVGSIVQLANALLTLKQELLGVHRDEKLDEWKFKGKPPFLIEGVAERAFREQLKQRAKGVVILTRTQLERDYLKDMLKTELIFTIQEAKGLEFKTVLLWKFCGHRALEEVWGSILKLKKASLHEALIRHEINLLYVGITRARLNLILYDGPQGSLIWDSPQLKDLVFRTREMESLDHAWQTLASPEEWKRQGDYFLEREYFSQAAECYSNAEEAGLMKRALAMASEKKGDYMQAARSWEALGERERAAEAYERASAFEEALKLWEALGHEKKAFACRIVLLEKAKDYKALSELWEKNGDIDKALIYWEKTGDFVRAGEYYEQNKSYRKAAEAYQKARDHSSAARLFELGKDYAEAARCLEASGKWENAAMLWKKARSAGDALRCAKRASDPLFLASFYEDIGEWEKALDQYGRVLTAQLKEKFRQEIEHAPKKKSDHARRALRLALLERPLDAAEAFSRAGVYALAGRCYKDAGAFHAAGKAYKKSASWLEAAPMFARSEEDRKKLHSELKSCLLKSFHPPSGIGISAPHPWRRLADTLQQEDRYEAASYIYAALNDWKEAAISAALGGNALRAATLWDEDMYFPEIYRRFRDAKRYKEGAEFAVALFRCLTFSQNDLREFSESLEGLFRTWLAETSSEPQRLELAETARSCARYLSLEFLTGIFEPLGFYDALCDAIDIKTSDRFRKASIPLKKWEKVALQKKSAGDWAGAGLYYLISGNLREADKCWSRVPVTSANRRCMLRTGLWERVAAFHEGRAEFMEAGVLFGLYGNLEKGMALFKKAGALEEGARALESCREWNAAYQVYKEAGNLRKCARMLEKMKQYKKAAKIFEKLGDEKSLKSCLKKIKGNPAQKSLFEDFDPD